MNTYLVKVTTGSGESFLFEKSNKSEAINLYDHFKDDDSFKVEFFKCEPIKATIFCSCKHGIKKKNYDECSICGGKWSGR